MIFLYAVLHFVPLALSSSQHEQTNISRVYLARALGERARTLCAEVTVGRFLIYMYDVPSRVLCLLSGMWSSVIWSVGPQRIDWLRRGRAHADDTLVTLL